jgi:hypothetical protein
MPVAIFNTAHAITDQPLLAAADYAGMYRSLKHRAKSVR